MANLDQPINLLTSMLVGQLKRDRFLVRLHLGSHVLNFSTNLVHDTISVQYSYISVSDSYKSQTSTKINSTNCKSDIDVLKLLQSFGTCTLLLEEPSHLFKIILDWLTQTTALSEKTHTSEPQKSWTSVRILVQVHSNREGFK